jgi:uncharacterized repeat protein (TIGR03843 family)
LSASDGDPGPVDDGGWDDEDGWDDDDDVEEPVGMPTRTTVVVPDYPDDPADLHALLTTGAMEVRGRMPWSSNGTFLVHLCGDAGEALGVYKPERGERPLWDFPPGLWRREVAAYELGEALGWEVVPRTVVRDDGPLGVGSVQLFVPFDPEAHYFTLYEDPATHDALRRLAVFDILANSTDRKGGHVLRGGDGRIWAIDNGLAFHEEFKLRTVIWEFGGDVIPADLAEAVEALLEGGLPDALTSLLAPDEVEALQARARSVVATRRFPIDGTGRRYPWPLV